MLCEADSISASQEKKNFLTLASLNTLVIPPIKHFY